MRKRRRARWVIAAMLAIAVGVLVAMRWFRPVEVTVMPVVRGRAVDAVYATGTVEADRRVTVKARVTGPIVELPVREADVVRADQKLARIDNPAANFELRRSEVEAAAATGKNAPQIALLQARIAAIEAQVSAATREEQRTKQLVASGAVGQSEADRAHDRVAELAAQREALVAQERAERVDLRANSGRTQAIVNALATKVSDAEVRTPQDGVVLARFVELGEVVAVNQPLFKVGDPDSLLLEVLVDEADIGRVHDGSDGHPASRVAASLHAFPGKSFGGHVTKLMPDADREKKTYLTKVRLDDPAPGLRSGMTVEVNIIVTERPGVLLAPADAIKDGHAWTVKDGRAEKRRVDVGIHDLLRAEVVSGLGEGESVVIGGADLLKRDGARIRATVKPADVLAGVPKEAR